MNENEKNMAEVTAEMDELFGGEELNLGSTADGLDFDPFASTDESGSGTEDNADDNDDDGTGDDVGDNIDSNDSPAETPATTEKSHKAPRERETIQADTNPLAAAFNDAETKTAEKTRQGLFGKAPVFDYAGAQEDIEDLLQTFEDLRIAKAADFPELADGKRVSWKVEYGKITKTVPAPKDTTINKMKVDIEQSKEFLDALKKTKDATSLRCKLKPQVTAQSKGKLPTYKGVFPNVEEAEASGKLISIIPARDGRVYEIRNTNMGRFITPIVGCNELSDVQAGFDPALPPVPADLLIRIISFFRYFMSNGNAGSKEALVNLYWDKHIEEFIIDTPEQVVTMASVHATINEKYHGERFIHYMDIHSHNDMKAFFSAIDDHDEKATRLYMVIGRLDKYFPDIKLRASNGGRFIDIHPQEIFELVGNIFPPDWIDSVHLRDSHEPEPLLDLPLVFGKYGKSRVSEDDFI